MNNQIIQEYAEYSKEQVDTKINNSHTAFQVWSKTDFDYRAHKLRLVGEVLIAGKQSYAEIISQEMGKPLTEAIKEVEKCAWVCEYYADHAQEFLKDEFITTEYTRSYVTYRPLGIVLAIMPWNFPFWQVFRFAAPTLMAGNTAVLKHASNVSGCALAIEEIFKKAGLDANIFQTLLVSAKNVEPIIANPLVKAVTLTGSTRAGKTVAQLAGAHLKKTVLELGGSDPYIILDDADLDIAAKLCTTSRLLNCGQSCIAAKRFIVHEKIHDIFIQKVKEQIQNAKLGPMARIDLRDELHQQVKKSIELGAKCIEGGEIPKGAGAFYPATILSNVKKDMPAYDEEIFGPVFSIIKVKDLPEALAVANDTEFGLGAAIFSKNLESTEKVAKQELLAGACFINDFVKSDPRLPFGGIGQSGYGRELSHHGIKEFVNVKTICVAKD